MTTIVAVNPFRCCMWPLHDRLEQHVDEHSCRAEIESVRKNGQLVPALGRPLPPNSEYDYELIYGARRLFIARHLNMQMLMEVRALTDLEGIIAMDIENRHRRDISPYERGVSYLRWLRSGQFKSQDELSRALKISASQVSRLLKLATLPAVVVAAFESPLSICETWAPELAEALEDPERRKLTCSQARAIAVANPRPPAKEVFRQLLSGGVKGRKVRSKPHDEVISDRHGKPLFRIRYQSRSIALMLSVDCVSENGLKRVIAALSSTLENSRA
jgi:ParB family chromosome partitioning protein